MQQQQSAEIGNRCLAGIIFLNHVTDLVKAVSSKGSGPPGRRGLGHRERQFARATGAYRVVWRIPANPTVRAISWLELDVLRLDLSRP